MDQGRGDYEPSRSILPAHVHSSCLCNQPYYYDKMTCWVSSFSLFCYVVQLKNQLLLGVVHIMAVNGPFVQNDQVVQKTLLLDSKRRLARPLRSSDQRTLLPRSLMSFFCFFSLICYFTPTLLDTVLLS